MRGHTIIILHRILLELYSPQNHYDITSNLAWRTCEHMLRLTNQCTHFNNSRFFSILYYYSASCLCIYILYEFCWVACIFVSVAYVACEWTGYLRATCAPMCLQLGNITHTVLALDINMQIKQLLWNKGFVI